MTATKYGSEKPVIFSDSDVEVEQSEMVYNGFFKVKKMQLRHRLFAGGWSDNISREVFVRGQAVAAVMYDPVNRLIGLIEQFRVGVIGSGKSPWLCEVVAGMAEEGEKPREVILRELVEEADMVPRELIHICDYFSSPGGTDEQLTLFCAVGDLTELGGIHGLESEGEDIRVNVLQEKEVFDNLYSGVYNNAATLICLQWLLFNHANIIEKADVSA